MRRIDRAVTILGVVLAAAGCGDSRAEHPGSQVLDSAGTQIVISTQPIWETGQEWSYLPEPDLVLGSVDSPDPATQFSRPTSVLTLSDGRIVVLESQGSELRYFDAEGNHLMTVGGEGDGPGEFNFAARAYRLPGDTILVEDRPRTKHVFFSPEGELVRAEVLDYEAYRNVADFVECSSQSLPDRSLLACVDLPGAEPRRSDPGPGLLRRLSQYVRIPWDLSGIDTLGVYGGIEQYGIRDGDRTSYDVHRFHSRTVTAIADDPVRIAIAINPSYNIEVWTPEGRLERILRRPGAARAPSSVETADARAELGERVFGSEALSQRFRDEVPTPDTVPAVASLNFATTGELLVGLRPPSDRTTEGRLMDVYDADGRWLGEFAGPPIGIHEIGEDYILGIRFDELFVPYIERYELLRNR